MDIGSKVKLISFNREKIAPENCDSAENYWLLIGKTGIVIKKENSRSRVLVQFEDSVDYLGLHCHNEVPNSLFIMVDDLTGF